MRFSLPAAGGALSLLGLCACATVSAPVLRHQTGETLGPKKFRASLRAEKSRIFAPASTTDTAEIEQEDSVFQGVILGLQAEAGILPKLDAQLGFSLTPSGGGWRVGAKYKVFQRGAFAGAAMLGYGASSGSGSVSYATSDAPIEIEQTLSMRILDFSMPVSFRIDPSFAIYGGWMLLRTNVNGSFGSSVVSDISYDPGLNIGVKITHGIFEGDLEFAMIRVHDPFMDGGRNIPFFGASFGILF